MADVHEMKKTELIEFIRQLQEKIIQLKELEAEKIQQIGTLKNPAIGIVRDEKTGNYSLVKLAYDMERNAAQIVAKEDLNSRDESIVLYKAKQFLGEKIFRKARGGKYDER